MSILRMIYLSLAIVGTILPLWLTGPWIADIGYDFITLWQSWQSNALASGLIFEMLIACITLTVFIVAEVYIRKDFWVLLCIPATWIIGLSCGLPLYLFLRTRPID